MACPIRIFPGCHAEVALGAQRPVFYHEVSPPCLAPQRPIYPLAGILGYPGIESPIGSTAPLSGPGGASSFREALGAAPYRLLQVINSRRPFTDTVEGCIRMKDSIEAASRLEVSGAIVNSHLVDETTVQVILEGYELAGAFSEHTDVPVEFVTAMGELADDPALGVVEAPLLRLERIMLPPWLQREEKHDSSIGNSSELAAGRVKPIGKP